ncbi:ComEA family DNA-binding protein [Mariniphaga sediminis]|uniref:ComEA family DNA-binding protein n=1 Tax=Mariniphaga sediminis TaxID=1628158 RepID=UPI00356A6BF4
MKQVFRYIALFFMISLPQVVLSQISDVSGQLEAIIESVLEGLEKETDAALIIEDLEGFAETPLNINTATRDQLSRLHLLDDIQIQKLLDYRTEFGPVLSIFELNTVNGLTPEVLTKMEPFIWFGPLNGKPLSVSERMKYGRHELIIRSLGTVQKPKGYQQKDDGSVPYQGNRVRYYSRYRFQSGDNISAGITAEKDPGEAFFRGSNKQGFDFYSGHLSLKISPVIENVIIGDFVVRSGQGLVLWQGFSTGKSIYSLNISKTNQGLRPYTSTDENQHFRGISTSLNLGNAQISIFYSQKNSDANRAFSDSLGNHFTSLQTSGYHRTENEIADKNSINDMNTGIVTSWRFTNMKIGTTFLYRQFNMPFIRNDQLYNRFRFRGKKNLVAGADYLFNKGKYQLFGEAAFSKSGGKAALQGAIAHLHDRIQVSALFRHLDKNYHALWAAPFSEGSLAANETGMYFGTRILPVKFVTFSAYSDFYRSKWINYTTAGPSNGRDIFAQADFRPSNRIQFYLRYKNEEKDQKFRIDEKYENHPERFQKSRFHIQYNLSDIFTLKTRLEHVLYKGLETENGWMIFQDVQMTPAVLPLSLSARVAWFSTESYNTRIYAYENDLLYTFSIPAYYSKGLRTYLNLKYKISPKADIWFKVANTWLHNAESIGSGYNEIQGNQKTEVKFQLKLKI